MSVPDKSIDPRILDSAKKEFLSYGFEAASLNNICKNSGVTTGALYKRYKGKEELFAAIVKDTIEDMDNFAEVRSSIGPESMTDEELLRAWDMDDDGKTLLHWFKFLQQRREGFILLISCSAGTRYENFQHDWVEKMSKATYFFYLELYNRGRAKEFISTSEMHMLMSAFWSTVYEPFIHGYDWSEIEKHCKIVCRLFDWYRVFGLE